MLKHPFMITSIHLNIKQNKRVGSMDPTPS